MLVLSGKVYSLFLLALLTPTPTKITHLLFSLYIIELLVQEGSLFKEADSFAPAVGHKEVLCVLIGLGLGVVE